MKQITNDALRLKLSQEYRNAHFTWVFTALFTLLFLLYSFDFAKQQVRVPVVVFLIVYAGTTLYVLFLTMRIKQDILTKREVQRRTRLFAYPLLLTILVGNIFAAGFAFVLANRHHHPEYTFASYAFLTQLFIIGVAAFNLFKPYVVDTFVLAMGLLIMMAIFYGGMIVLTAKFVTAEAAPKWMVFPGILLLFSLFMGNFFAVLLGYSLLKKTLSANPSSIEKWHSMWLKITRNTMAIFGMFFITFIFSLSVVSEFVFDYDFATQNNYSAILQSPSLLYPLGTDDFGRDLFSRIVFGAQISLIVGFASTVIPFLIGGTLGAISGYFGRTTDSVIMRLLDVLYAIPGILLAIAIIAAFGANTVNLIIALSVGAIPTYARTMRATVMQLSNYEFVEAARALGASDASIIFKQIVPNALAPMIVKATLTIGGAVIATSSLSFLGLGIEPHIPEWGNILKVGSTYLETHSYVAIFPGICIMLLVLSFNFFGDGLRDALDPKTN